ncbi:MAG: hypothetical protein A4E59_02895 [Syntrophorhabdus sp. PtaB.Bin027]|jgi:hypothetical protein|nr:MAG: hypothetical protein A4E59_02895 [Syntrophorhabdus sp. PtaB.Bin027]
MGTKRFANDTGEQRPFVTNRIEEMAEDGRIKRRTQRIDLNSQVGQGCKLEPDPPDPFAKKKGK